MRRYARSTSAAANSGTAFGPSRTAPPHKVTQVKDSHPPIHRRFNIHVGRCTGCGQRAQGRHPLQTSDALGAAASQLGADAQAAIVVLNKEAGLSHGKIAACFDSLFGIKLSRGASAQIVLRAAERLEPTYQRLLEATAATETLTVDETGWRVGGHPAWLHVWVGERATCYAIDSQRSAAVLERVLGRNWDGVLVHDGFSSYDRFDQAVHQQCLAHVLRRAQELLAEATRGAVRFPRQVIELFRGAIHLRNQRLAGRVAAAEWRNAREDYEERLLQLLVVDRHVPAYTTLANHLEQHFTSWFSFLWWPALPATNWLAEQALRPAVVNRKVWGGNRTDVGASAQAILMSVLRTCRQQARAGFDFVSRTLRAFSNPRVRRPVLLIVR